MKFIKSKKYDKEFLKQNMMGPNCLKLLEALMEGITLPKGGRVLDLGCGKGLTSIFLAKEYGLKVFATDLWIPATENFERFKEAGLEESTIPIHAEAHALPFADGYFDAAVSVDAYHYFGRDEEYIDKYLAPLVKKGGVIAVTVPSLKEEHDGVPAELQPFLTPEDFDTLHSRGWWGDIFSKSKMLCVDSLTEYTSDEAWEDWLESDNEYAVRDRDMMSKGGGYFNFVSMKGRRM
jgi:cyclopropane fatty-acyl-phospholipid synthase-like methyltransferase